MADLKAWVRTLKDAPPLRHLRQRRYEALFAAARDAVLFRGVYGSFEEALRHVPTTGPVGYDNPGPSAMFRDLVDRVNPRDYPLMFWLSHALRGGARSVFDFGGHVGIKFYAYRRYVDYPDDLRWTVCDVPAVVESGRKFAGITSGGERLAFTTRFEEADGCDLLFAAGSLQYVEEPFALRLARLARRPGRLLLSGVPLFAGRSFITLQSIGTAYCPYHVWNRDEFVAALESVGYALRDEWRNPEKSLHVPFHPGAQVDAYTGLLFEARS